MHLVDLVEMHAFGFIAGDFNIFHGPLISGGRQVVLFILIMNRITDRILPYLSFWIREYYLFVFGTSGLLGSVSLMLNSVCEICKQIVFR